MGGAPCISKLSVGGGLHDHLASISTVLEMANSLGVEGGKPGFRRR
jgi:hypothetical protein